MISASNQPWPRSPERAADQAIRDFGLQSKGWQGFNQLEWVKDVRERHPDAVELAHTCSALRPGYQEQAKALFEKTSEADRPLLRDFFAGKLGLEELSCRLNGAGAGSCDKKAAFREIYSIADGYI